MHSSLATVQAAGHTMQYSLMVISRKSFYASNKKIRFNGIVI